MAGFSSSPIASRRRALAGLFFLLVAVTPGQLHAQEPDPEDAGSQPPEAVLDVDEILSTPAETYVDTPRCIRVGRIRDTEVIDNQHIAFKVSRSKYYLVQLDFPCPTMRRDSTIMHSSSGLRICALDRVQAVSGYGMSRHVGPPCQIPGFQEITREQLVLLKERLKHRREGDLIDEIEADGEAAGEATEESAPAQEEREP